MSHDDDDDLITLALGSAEPIDDVTMARARRIVREPGGLARAYRVLDDAGAVLLAAGLDDGRLGATPLARLLEDEAARAAAASAGGGGGGIARALSSRVVPMLAAAAALVAFAVVRDVERGGEDTVARRTGGSGTKGASVQGVPAVVVSVVDVRGPLGAAGVVHGLEPRAEALARCSDERVVVDVRFRVRGDGLVDGAATASAADRAAAACVADVVEQTAFAFNDDATDVEAAIELHPSSEGAHQ